MISEGLCDTEDWRNDAKYSALDHTDKLNLKFYFNKKQLF